MLLTRLWLLALLAADWSERRRGAFYPLSAVADPALEGAAAAVVSLAGGSGFFVSPAGHLLTNHHVAQASGAMTVATLDRPGEVEIVELELLLSDPARDAAVYKARSDHPTPWIPIREAPPAAGEPVAALGFPRRGEAGMYATFGRVVAEELVIDGRSLVRYDAQTWWGSSGSPILDPAGRAIAMHWGWDAGATGGLAGIPLARLLAERPDIAALAGEGR